MKKEKILNLLIFIILFCAILSRILINQLDNLDEIWNYNFARNIANGLVPYKDFNMLQMPLLPLICGAILKIVTNQLIVMRVLAAILCSAIFYTTYRIFNILNIKKEINIIFTLCICCLFYNLFCIDYNYATLLIVLCIIYKEIKAYTKDNIFIKQDYKSDLILGLLAGLTVTLKQTTGLFICMALLGNKLLFVRKKEDFKNYIKSAAFRLIGVAIPVTLMIVYLVANNAFGDFISYTIKGVTEFSNYVSYTNLINPDLIGILSILVPISFVYTGIKTIFLGKDKKSYIFLVYGLAMFVVCFPISDQIHFLIGSLPAIISILYEVYKLLKVLCKKFIEQSVLEFIMEVLFFVCIILIWGIVYCVFLNFYNFKNSNYSNFNSYKYIPISDVLEEQISDVKQYISSSDKDIKILDATATVYMIPLERYNKNYDMLLRGNLGQDGENKIINEIKNSKNTQYLILKDQFAKNWQTPFDIIDYVKCNKTKVGEVNIFDIYE